MRLVPLKIAVDGWKYQRWMSVEISKMNAHPQVSWISILAAESYPYQKYINFPQCCQYDGVCWCLTLLAESVGISQPLQSPVSHMTRSQRILYISHILARYSAQGSTNFVRQQEIGIVSAYYGKFFKMGVVCQTSLFTLASATGHSRVVMQAPSYWRSVHCSFRFFLFPQAMSHISFKGGRRDIVAWWYALCYLSEYKGQVHRYEIFHRQIHLFLYLSLILGEKVSFIQFDNTILFTM